MESIDKATGDAAQQAAITRRSDNLWKLTEASEANVLNFLTLSTGGGAVATLSFMGAAPELRGLFWPRMTVAAFVLGLFVCGVMAAVEARIASMAYVQFLKDASEFQQGKMSWQQLSSRSSPQGGPLTTVLQFIAYALLAIALFSGALSVWYHVPSTSKAPSISSPVS